MAKEKWKRLKEEKEYLISSWGRIFSTKTERIMKPNLHQSRSNKYLRIELNKSKYMVHVLVASNFKAKQYLNLITLYPRCVIEVDHDDRNTLNPAASNVNWKTSSENKVHRHRTDIITFGGKTYKGKSE